MPMTSICVITDDSHCNYIGLGTGCSAMSTRSMNTSVLGPLVHPIVTVDQRLANVSGSVTNKQLQRQPQATLLLPIWLQLEGLKWPRTELSLLQPESFGLVWWSSAIWRWVRIHQMNRMNSRNRQQVSHSWAMDSYIIVYRTPWLSRPSRLPKDHSKAVVMALIDRRNMTSY